MAVQNIAKQRQGVGMRILYFAPVYYDDMKQRPQQLAECLSQKHEVYYIEPTVSLIRWLIKRGRPYQGEVRQISSSLKCIRLNGVFTLHKSIEVLDFLGINNCSEYRQIKKLADSCDMIWTGYSGWYTLVRHLKGKPVVFDWMDEEELLVSSRLWKLTLKHSRRKLLQSVDLVFVTSRKFYKQLKTRKNVCYVPNALSQDFLCEKNYGTPEQKKTSGKIIFGYVGTIGEWFDFAVIKRILSLDRNYHIVLVGKNTQPEFVHERVTYLGVRPHRELPELIRGFDVCLYNFKKGRLLHTVNPVKIYEYLAVNKPVLAVWSRETEAFKKHVMLYHEPREIKALLLNGIRRPFTSEDEYLKFVSSNTWMERSAAIEAMLSRQISAAGQIK